MGRAARAGGGRVGRRACRAASSTPRCAGTTTCAPPSTTTGGTGPGGSPTATARAGHEEVEQLTRLLHELPPARILDVACGTGVPRPGICRATSSASTRARGCSQVAAARLPHGRVVQGDAVPLPFPDGAFDRIITSHFYGHLLPGERETFLTEARRVARELIVIDSARRPETGAEEWQERTLNDGSVHSGVQAVL